LKQLIDEYGIDEIVFCGKGETTLQPNFRNSLEWANEFVEKVTIITNGVVQNYSVFDFAKSSNKFMLRLSHDKNNALYVIKAYMQLVMRVKAAPLITYVLSNNPGNIEFLEKFYKFFHDTNRNIFVIRDFFDDPTEDTISRISEGRQFYAIEEKNMYNEAACNSRYDIGTLTLVNQPALALYENLESETRLVKQLTSI